MLAVCHEVKPLNGEAHIAPCLTNLAFLRQVISNFQSFGHTSVPLLNHAALTSGMTHGHRYVPCIVVVPEAHIPRESVVMGE